MPGVNFSPSIIILKYLRNSPVIIQPFFNELPKTNMLPLVSLYGPLLLLFCLSSDCSRMSLSWTDGPTILFSSSMKRTEMTRSCGCCLAYLLLSTDPYRIVSEEAQLGRVVMDLTWEGRWNFSKLEEKRSCSTLSKKKKTKNNPNGVCEYTCHEVCMQGQVSCIFLLAKWLFTILCDRLSLPSN